MSNEIRRQPVVVVGASWGGVEAIIKLLSLVPDDFPGTVVLVQHRHNDAHAGFERSLRRYTTLPVREVEDKEPMLPASIYLAPANYHLLLERDWTFSLCVSPPVFYSRPSIDVTMQSIARIVGDRVIGVLLTGANEDGTAGLAAIQRAGGYTVVQDPEEAASGVMPRNAIEQKVADRVMKLKEIIPFIVELLRKGYATHHGRR